jgi:hypothetical protein
MYIVPHNVFLATHFLAIFLCLLIGSQGRVQLSTEGGQLLFLARGVTQRLSLAPHEDIAQEAQPRIVQGHSINSRNTHCGPTRCAVESRVIWLGDIQRFEGSPTVLANAGLVSQILQL